MCMRILLGHFVDIIRGVVVMVVVVVVVVVERAMKLGD